jgi:hypothetical protein
MNLPTLLFRTLIVLTLIASVSAAASAQADDPNKPQPNFQIALHLIVGGSDTGNKSELPASLAAVTRQIRAAVPYSSYRLANTYIGRVGNGGNFEYKSVADLLGRSESDPATFLEWSVGGIRLVGTDYQAQSFRFGARVPVNTEVTDLAGGNKHTVVNYEPIGLSFRQVGVGENVPTLLGTLTLPKTAETLFLVMTVSRSDH